MKWSDENSISGSPAAAADFITTQDSEVGYDVDATSFVKQAISVSVLQSANAGEKSPESIRVVRKKCPAGTKDAT